MGENGKSDSKRAVLAVLEILKKYTDADHPISNAQIRAILEKEHGIKKHRDTIKNTLEELVDFYGDNIIKRKITDLSEESDYTYNYYYSQLFSNEELHVLINSVMFAKMLTDDQVKRLTKSLKSLATEHFIKELDYINTLPDKQYTINKRTINNFMKILKIIYENKHKATNSEKRIRFQFNNYGVDDSGNATLSKSSAKKHELLPLRICEVNHRYYLIGYMEGKMQLYHYRIDLITDIEEKEYTGLEKNNIKEKLINSLTTKTVSQYMSEHFYMFFGDAKEIIIEINSNNGFSPDGGYTLLFDTFGENWRLIEKKKDSIKVSVRCVVDAMKILVMQYIDRIKVIGPPDIKKEIELKIADSLKKYLDL